MKLWELASKVNKLIMEDSNNANLDVFTKNDQSTTEEVSSMGIREVNEYDDGAIENGELVVGDEYICIHTNY